MTARDFAENAWLAVVARFSMIALAPIFAATVFFGANWLDGRFDAQASSTAAVADRVKSLEEDNLPNRLSILENTIVIKGAARDRQISDMAVNQNELAVKVDKLQDTVASLSSNIAALNATLRATEDRRP